MLYYRGQKLEESYAYQVFSANVEEEEAWISEKQHLLSGGDYGDTMAAVQGLLKKHEVFETDFHIHKERCNEIKKEGEKLISEVRFSAIDCFQCSFMLEKTSFFSKEEINTLWI